MRTHASFITGLPLYNLGHALVLGAIGLFLTLPQKLAASPSVCAAATEYAARQTGVPENVLIAIAKVETGRTTSDGFHPWPWTINTSGKGQWFQNRDQLLEAALTNLALGNELFDVGCFQINYKWHHDSFNSVDEMIDPHINAMYAAKFLKSLHSEFGDWTQAAGAYHSRTEKFATRYKAKFAEHFDPNATVQTDTLVANSASRRQAVVTRQNNFPLLQQVQSSPRLGSLVPNIAN